MGGRAPGAPPLDPPMNWNNNNETFVDEFLVINSNWLILNKIDFHLKTLKSWIIYSHIQDSTVHS